MLKSSGGSQAFGPFSLIAGHKYGAAVNCTGTSYGEVEVRLRTIFAVVADGEFEPIEIKINNESDVSGSKVTFQLGIFNPLKPGKYWALFYTDGEPNLRGNNFTVEHFSFCGWGNVIFAVSILLFLLPGLALIYRSRNC